MILDRTRLALCLLTCVLSPGAALSQGQGKVQVVAAETVQGMVLSAAFSPDGKRLVTGGMDKTARVWDLANPEKPLVLERQPATVRGVAFSPDGKSVCTAADLGTVAMWDAESGKQRWAVKLPGDSPKVAFAPNGKTVAVSGVEGAQGGPRQGVVVVLDAGTGKEVWATRPGDRYLLSVTFAPDSRTVGAGGPGGAHLLDAPTGKLQQSLKADQFFAEGLAYSPDGKRLYGSGGKRVVAWDPATGEEKARFEPLTGTVRALAVSADGKRLVTAGDTAYLPYGKGGTAIFMAFAVLDSASGRVVSRFEGSDRDDTGTVWAVALSPDGKTVAAGGHGHLALYDAATGGRQRMLLNTVNRVAGPPK
jgi:DNA-binding beta-propeller fold protein YncE